jgi:hypothetical protein
MISDDHDTKQKVKKVITPVIPKISVNKGKPQNALFVNNGMGTKASSISMRSTVSHMGDVYERLV